MLDTKKILAENISALLATRPDLPRMEIARQMKVGDGTLGNIKYGKGNPTIEVLEQIAKFFNLEAWQLLVPKMGLKGSLEGYLQQDPSSDATLQMEVKLQRLEELNKVIGSRDASIEDRVQAVAERIEIEKFITEEAGKRFKLREERGDFYSPYSLRNKKK